MQLTPKYFKGTEINLITAQKLNENKGYAFLGIQNGGLFDVPSDVAELMLSSGRNRNGRHNSDVVRPRIDASDITAKPHKKWTVFFDMDMSEADASLYEKPFEYLKKRVKEEINSEQWVTKKWWLPPSPIPETWNALNGKTRYIVTPRVAKHRVFVWVAPNTVPGNRLVVIARDDDYFFGVLQSRIHEIWRLGMGSRLGNGGKQDRPIYDVESCFETFPFPWTPDEEPKDDLCLQAIGQAAKELVEQRDRWLNAEGLTSAAEKKKRTLMNLYDTRPAWLYLAHKRLDEAVFAAYGWNSDLSDGRILEKLLALNRERGKRWLPPFAQA